MALSYQLDPNLASTEIAGVQSRGGFDPTNPNAISDSVADLVGTVNEVVIDKYKMGLAEDIRGDVQAVSDALTVIAHPDMQKQLFSQEALQNPSTKAAFDEFGKIQLAMKQGRLPADYAIDRMVQVQNDAIARNPEFEKEIRAAMQEASGMNVVAKKFSDLMSPSQSPEQKAAAHVKEMAARYGITPEEYQEMSYNVFKNTADQATFDRSRRAGQATADALGLEAQVGMQGVGQKILTSLMEQTKEGGIIDPEIQTANIRGLVESYKASYLSGIAASVNSAVAIGEYVVQPDQAVIDKHLAAMDAAGESWIKMVENGDMQTMLTRHNAIVKQFAIRDFQGMGVLGKVYAAMGPENLFSFLETVEKWQGNPALGKAASPKFAAVSTIFQELMNVGSGIPVKSDEQRYNRAAAAALMLTAPRLEPEKQVQAHDELVQTAGETTAFATYGTPKMVRAVARSKQLQAAFINLHASHTKGLIQEYMGLVEAHGASLDKVVMTPTGQLALSQEDVVARAQQRAQGVRLDVGATTALPPALSVEVTSFMDKMNRALRISKQYSTAGLLPQTSFTTEQAYWTYIQEQAAALKQGTASPEMGGQETVIEYEMDASGNLVRKQNRLPDGVKLAPGTYQDATGSKIRVNADGTYEEL